MFLGLSHSSVEGSLMFPWYSNVPQDFSLPEDDRIAVQHLYGPPQEEEGAAHPPHLPHKETLSSTLPSHPTTLLPPHQRLPQKCQTNFDAVAVIRSEMWAFKAGLWIRIPIGSGFSNFVDPDSQYGSRGKKVKKFQWKNALFSI
jgi:hypothetical protein